MIKDEKETRLKLTDPKLRLAGWEILYKRNIIEKGKACIETPIYGLPKTTENVSGNGFADYVLFGDDGIPLAVIEVKKSSKNEDDGRIQACLYADALENMHGVRPIIYYTNGYSIKIIDGTFPDRNVFGFHKKEELEYLIQKRKFKLFDKFVDTTICGRYYQKDAIEKVLEFFENKHSRSLIVLATGTGKTRVSCALSDIFLRNNYVKRILFLADRKNLVKQAKEETFEKFLKTIPMFVVVDGKKEGDENQARIVFSTYQSMLSIIKDTSKNNYGIGHFDLIIIDEAHRSLFNKYAEIFEYFDALMIGLTATPRNDINKSTYKVFNLDTCIPNYEYDVIKGVKDGYLTYYRALDRTPDILKNGVTYENLPSDEKEKYEELFTDNDGTMPEKIEGKEFYSTITNKDTIREVLKDLMDEGLKVNNGDILGKTIIFARDHNHAMMILEEFRFLYPDKCNLNSKNGIDFCVVIDNKIKYNEVLQREFKNGQAIRIVISVDMMDTGVDIPEVVNLVFFKKVLSKIKFWQMVGRGTRICNNLKILSPSKAYFERQTNNKNRQLYDSKQGFLIFDICNVFPFFKLNPDGRTDSAEQSLSLYQKIFLQKVILYNAMFFNFNKLLPEDKEYFELLKIELLNEIKKLNRNYIGVIKNLEYVNKYSELNNWLDFSQQKVVEIKKFIAPNIQGEIDLESSRVFDLLCYKFSSSKFNKDNCFKLAANKLYKISSYLLNSKINIPDVASCAETLKYVTSDEFLHFSSFSKIESIRKELRELIQYIDQSGVQPIISDFDDKISSFDDVDEEKVNFDISIDDFKSFEEKTISFIKNNPNISLINKLRIFIKPTNEDIENFKKKIIDLAKTVDEFNEFIENNDIVSFVRKNIDISHTAINQFIELQIKKGLNESQIKYVKELLLFIFKNGKFKKTDLLREELNFNSIFNNEEISSLIKDIEDRL